MKTRPGVLPRERSRVCGFLSNDHSHAARLARGLPLGRDDPPRLAQVALERVIRDLIEQDADPPAGAHVPRVKIDVGRFWRIYLRPPVRRMDVTLLALSRKRCVGRGVRRGAGAIRTQQGDAQVPIVRACARPPRHLFYPRYVGAGGWLGILLDQIADDALESHLREARQIIASKRKPKPAG